MKIFAIGFNKTGTSSLHDLFKRFGLRSLHGAVKKNTFDNYDAFTDGNPVKFKEYYEKYPDSLFILNTRPLEKWLISRYKHAKHFNFRERWCWPVSIERTKQWITEREIHHQNVLDFFLDKPSQLLILNIEKPGWVVPLSIFLKKEPLTVEPKSNKTEIDDKTIINNIKSNVSLCLKETGFTGKELLTKNPNMELYKYNKYL